MKIKILFLGLVIVGTIANAQQLNTVSTLLGSNTSLDYRSYQSPVKHQGVKYTCTAFAIAAVLETFPNVPKDLSEKYLYAMQKAYQYSNNISITQGHKFEWYLTSLVNDGVIEEKYLPYTFHYDGTQLSEGEFSKMLFEGEVGFMTLMTKYKPKATVFVTQYELLDFNQSKNIAYLKQLLNSGIKAIAISYQNLYLPAWQVTPSNQFKTITPDDGFLIPTGGNIANKYSVVKPFYHHLNQLILQQKIPFVKADKNPANYMGHAVAIVGYDTEGFIIKNSYGSGFRVGGYERVSYDFHELFAQEGLVIKAVQVKKQSFLQRLF